MSEINLKKVYPFFRWMVWLFLAGSILLLLYTFYRAEIIFRGGEHGKYFKYYVISLAGVLFWGGVLQLRKKVQSNIVMVATSLVVGLYMVETALILSKYPSDDRTARIAAAFELGVEFDERTRIEAIEAIIAEEGSAAFLSPLLLREDQDGAGLLLPLGGVSKTTTMLGNEGGVHATFKSDRHGFNNPDSEWDFPQVEWLLVGDSFTQGVAVNSGEDIAGQIRAITGSTAINLGISGNGPLIELAALKEYAESLQPKKVLWLYFEGNDFRDLLRESPVPLLMRYMQDNFSQDLMHRQQEIDESMRELFEKEKKRMRGNGYIKWAQLHSIRFMTGFDKMFALTVFDVDLLFTKILTKAKARTEAWGGELYFVYLPDFERYIGTSAHGLHRRKSEVLEMVKGAGIPVIDIHQEVFADHPDPLSLFPLRMNSHYNAEGYSETAKAIVANIGD